MAADDEQLRAMLDDRSRATLGCEKRDGIWVIPHAHESAPFDAGSGNALSDLEP